MLAFDVQLPLQSMDTGHYNCRDYHISPHFSATTLVSETNARQQWLNRHESFNDLEERSRSPASHKPKFPLFRLPLELRQQILSYLLPNTQEYRDAGLLSEHARNFSAVQKRGARGMAIPSVGASAASVSNVVWQRGNVNLFRVCRQLHQECAELVYGTNTFLLFLTYADVTFRFRWLLPSGLAPSRSYKILDLLSARYLSLIRKVVVHVDHVDSYTGMIKFNVGGEGLKYGLRRQVQRLVNALQASPEEESKDEEMDHELAKLTVEECDPDDERLVTRLAGLAIKTEPAEHSLVKPPERRLTRLTVKVSTGNSVLDSLKDLSLKDKDSEPKIPQEIEYMLEPFGELDCVQYVNVVGAVTPSFARNLEQKMQTKSPPGSRKIKVDDEGMAALSRGKGPPLCVYGNDMI